MGSKVKDITGNTYNRLTVISYSGMNKNGLALWNCKCQCGNEVILSSNEIKTGNTKSCGCLKREMVLTRFRKHGESYKSKEYAAWTNIRYRCRKKDHPQYMHYGGRGIEMCDRWFESFEKFLLDMGRAPTKKHSIERKNNNGHYEPDNCKWATQAEQANNTRRNKLITFQGETKNLQQWCRLFGLNRNSVNYKLRVGKTTDQIFENHLTNKGL